jgi:hypothetical protein
LRDLQKTFEDWFNNPESFNALGLILKTRGDKKEILLYYLKTPLHEISLNEFAKWAILEVPFDQIISSEIKKDEQTKEQRAKEVFEMLNSTHIYWDENGNDFVDGRKEMAFRQLLRLNVEMDNRLKRKFNFDLYNERSLEHIHPKSKNLNISHENKDDISIHCIGNLVLLSGPDNSAFKDKSYYDKKNTYFNPEYVRNSMSFLHSLTVFSKNHWTEAEIKENKSKFLDNFCNTYNLNQSWKQN